MNPVTDYEAARIRALEYKALIEDGYRRDGIVGVMGRVSVPLGSRMPGIALRPGLEALVEALEEVVALLVEEEDAQPDPAGGNCAMCGDPFSRGGSNARASASATAYCNACTFFEADDDGA